MKTKTSEEWWSLVREDEVKTKKWLLSQFRGENLAAERIEVLRDKYTRPVPCEGTFGEAMIVRAYKILTTIANQERTHAAWVSDLLIARGISTTERPKNKERYWPKAMESIKDLYTGCAVASKAEKMRLERIAAIVSDPYSPKDIKAVFTKILPQELFHERVFREIAGPNAMEDVAANSAAARAALGLTP